MEKILIIDDHNGVREGIVMALSKNESRFTFLQAANCDEAVKILAENPDCRTMILDMKLKNESGIDALRKIRALQPEIKTLVWTMYWEPAKVLAAVEENVEGYITKDSEIADLKKALLKVAAGEKYFCSEVSHLVNAKFDFRCELDDERRRTQILFNNYRTLTKKEQEVFLLLLQGNSTKTASELLDRSQKTIENQRDSIYKKLSVHDRAEMMLAGKELGLV